MPDNNQEKTVKIKINNFVFQNIKFIEEEKENIDISNMIRHIDTNFILKVEPKDSSNISELLEFSKQNQKEVIITFSQFEHSYYVKNFINNGDNSFFVIASNYQ